MSQRTEIVHVTVACPACKAHDLRVRVYCTPEEPENDWPGDTEITDIEEGGGDPCEASEVFFRGRWHLTDLREPLEAAVADALAELSRG